MSIVVQKFGGTSVSSLENKKLCIKHIKNEIKKGNKVVVVVSAMGRMGAPYATDTLISLTNEDDAFLNKREMDLLLSTGEIISASSFSSLLNKEGISNIVLTGQQAGIITNADFGSAMIIGVEPKRILEELNKNEVVVVPGFQGGTITGEITTLGRGGSDTTASALGVGLKAKVVDIFTDVDGVMTADPRIVKDAIKLDDMTYQEVSQMALSGAKVIHPRAVELAMRYNIPMRIRSTFSDNEGTIVTDKIENVNGFCETERLISGIVSSKDLFRFEILNKENSKNNFEDIFLQLEEKNISIDFIHVSPEKTLFTVKEEHQEEVKNIVNELNYQYYMNSNYAKVSIVGGGMNGVSGVMSKIIRALTNEKIEVIQTADSNTTIWILVEKEQEKKAVLAIHNVFFN